MRIKFILATTVFLVLLNGIHTTNYAQAKEPLYQINWHMGFGYSFYLTSLEYENLHTTPFILTTRFMWQPEHLLRIGIESGYVPLFLIETKEAQSVFGTTDIKISLDTVPIMLVFSMEIYKKLEIFGGLGEFLLFSEMNSFGNKVVSKSWSNGYEFGVSYLKPIRRRLQIGGEIKMYYISKIQDADLLLQAGINYNILSY